MNNRVCIEFQHFNNKSLGYHDFFNAYLHQRDINFLEVLSLGDIARLEVAAAVHTIHDSQVDILSGALYCRLIDG
jgi:hypothetical protein